MARKLRFQLIPLFFTFMILMINSYQCNAHAYYAKFLCHDDAYTCIKIPAHESWSTLFPDERLRDMIMRVNRINTPLKRGMMLAIPKNFEEVNVLDLSPFPKQIASLNEKTIFINQTLLAFAAYDEQGELVWWGPISPGKRDCDSKNSCLTPSGYYRIIRKQDESCVSTVFPIADADEESGGAPMPYCMHFFRGFALHGSEEVPGYPASHGCVRLFVEDARWLNEQFIDTPSRGTQGTRVVIGDPK
jgi:hypothetical protein